MLEAQFGVAIQRRSSVLGQILEDFAMGGLEDDIVVGGAGFRRNAITVVVEGASIPSVRIRLWRAGIGYGGNKAEMGDR